VDPGPVVQPIGFEQTGDFSRNDQPKRPQTRSERPWGAATAESVRHCSRSGRSHQPLPWQKSISRELNMQLLLGDPSRPSSAHLLFLLYRNANATDVTPVSHPDITRVRG